MFCTFLSHYHLFYFIDILTLNFLTFLAEMKMNEVVPNLQAHNLKVRRINDGKKFVKLTLLALQVIDC